MAHLSVAQAWMPTNFWPLPASIAIYEPKIFATAGEGLGYRETVPNGAFADRNCLAHVALARKVP
jgi:hypothetical protein